MTRTSNARVAGCVFLLYIVTGVASMVLSGQVTGGVEGTAAKLAAIAQHATLVKVNILLTLLQAGYAVVLGVTLYALTREEDRELSAIALCCRVGEGIVSVIAPLRSLALLSIAGASGFAAASDPAATQVVASLLLKIGGWTSLIAATLFAVGSTLFSYLFLRARSIPTSLAWVGVLASALLVVALPIQLCGFVRGPITAFIWIPMFVFEVGLAVWLLFKGVATPESGYSASVGSTSHR